MYKSITTAVAILALAGAGTAFAQTPANSSAQPTSKAAWHAKHAQRMQTHLAKLKAQLKITSQQESAWNGFTQALQNMRPTMNSKMKRQAANLTAPEIFDGMAKRAQQRAQKTQALDKAADNLYGQLSSGQKAAWNKSIAEMHAKMHHRWHKRHGASQSPGMQGSAGGQG